MSNLMKARLEQTYLESTKRHDVEEPNTKEGLMKRIAENNRLQAEKDKQYDLDNDIENIEPFVW